MELWFWESLAVVPVYRPAKRLATLRVIATMLSDGIVANASITNVPWSSWDGYWHDAFCRHWYKRES